MPVHWLSFKVPDHAFYKTLLTYINKVNFEHIYKSIDFKLVVVHVNFYFIWYRETKLCVGKIIHFGPEYKHPAVLKSWKMDCMRCGWCIWARGASQTVQSELICSDIHVIRNPSRVLAKAAQTVSWLFDWCLQFSQIGRIRDCQTHTHTEWYS